MKFVSNNYRRSTLKKVLLLVFTKYGCFDCFYGIFQILLILSIGSLKILTQYLYALDFIGNGLVQAQGKVSKWPRSMVIVKREFYGGPLPSSLYILA